MKNATAPSNPKGALIELARLEIEVLHQLVGWHGQRLRAMEDRLVAVDGQRGAAAREVSLNKVLVDEPEGLLFAPQDAGKAEQLRARERYLCRLMAIAEECSVEEAHELRVRVENIRGQLALLRQEKPRLIGFEDRAQNV